jgi:hypothetical protein
LFYSESLGEHCENASREVVNLRSCATIVEWPRQTTLFDEPGTQRYATMITTVLALTILQLLLELELLFITAV